MGWGLLSVWQGSFSIPPLSNLIDHGLQRRLLMVLEEVKVSKGLGYGQPGLTDKAQ